LQYRLNGLLVLVVTVALYAALSVAGVKDPTFLANNFLACWISGVLIGVFVSIAFYVSGKMNPPVDEKYLRCVTVDMVSIPSSTKGKTFPSSDDTKVEFLKHPVLDPKYNQKPWIFDFFNGLEFNPRVLGVDIKMMLYCWGATLLQLNILSMAWQHIKLNGGVLSNAMATYVFCFT
jgi:uncharacterized protein YneF (UPF0154 family)